jgi:tetratricopeptide (TPR) repeat protein
MGVYNDRFHRTVEMFRDPAAVEGKVVTRWLGEVNNNLGLAYEILGDFPKAAENYRNAVGYNPAMTLAYYNLAIVSVAMGDFGKYSEQKQILMMLDPVLAERLRVRTGER